LRLDTADGDESRIALLEQTLDIVHSLK